MDRAGLLDALIVERYTPEPGIAYTRAPDRPWTAAEQAAHVAELERELDAAPTTPGLVLLDTPDTDVDEVAVERFIAGDRVPLTAAERRAAARRMLRAGHTKTAAAHRLGVSTTTVTRWLQEAS